jgi:hypothetical protein
LIWGTDFDPAIRPLLAVGFCETLAGSTAWPFLGVWALEHLGASQVELSVGFLVGALAARPSATRRCGPPSPRSRSRQPLPEQSPRVAQ